MKPEANRLRYLDWARGLAAIVMLQGHVFDSFLRTDLRAGGAFTFSQFLGGMPPAVFLFLLGVTYAFLLDSQERKGMEWPARWRGAVKRAGYLLAVAFLFRLQLWVFAMGRSPVSDLLRVDVLNAMGVALLVFSPMVFFRTMDRVRLCAVLGAAIALAGPAVTALDGAALPALVKGYLLPDHLLFGFFPWAAYVAFGMSAGSVLRVAKSEEMPVVMQWFAWIGLAMAFGAWFIADMGPSVYPRYDFWLNSPELVLIKTGVVLMLIAVAWVWNARATGFSWVRQFGMSSLLVYWVHVELIYGNTLGVLKGILTVGQTVLAAGLTILLMLGLSLAWTNRTAIRQWFASVEPERLPDRVSGD